VSSGHGTACAELASEERLQQYGQWAGPAAGDAGGVDGKAGEVQEGSGLAGLLAGYGSSESEGG